MTDMPVDATPAPTPRKRGRPPGAKTDPAKKAAAAAARRRETAGPAAPITPRTIADAVAPPERESNAGRPSVSDKLAKSLALNYHALGGITGALGAAFPGPWGVRLREVGAAIEAGAEDCGKALATWADTNAAVKRFLTEGSSFGALAMVLAAHAPIGAALIGPGVEAPSPPGEPAGRPPAVDPNPLTEALNGLGLGA